MSGRLANKVVIITGAGTGIGKAAAFSEYSLFFKGELR